MRFYDAVIAGCKILSKQALGMWGNQEKRTGCILAAAAVGSEFKVFDESVIRIVEHLRKEFPVLDKEDVCPFCPPFTKFFGSKCRMDLLNLCMHLNDTHHISREEIAAWVSQFEDECSPNQIPVSVVPFTETAGVLVSQTA